MIDVVIFTPETRALKNIPTSGKYSISCDPEYYKEYFANLVEMTLDDITWKRILSMDIEKLPGFLKELLSQHNNKVLRIINIPQKEMRLAA